VGKEGKIPPATLLPLGADLPAARCFSPRLSAAPPSRSRTASASSYSPAFPDLPLFQFSTFPPSRFPLFQFSGTTRRSLQNRRNVGRAPSRPRRPSAKYCFTNVIVNGACRPSAYRSRSSRCMRTLPRCSSATDSDSIFHVGKEMDWRSLPGKASLIAAPPVRLWPEATQPRSPRQSPIHLSCTATYPINPALFPPHLSPH